MEGDVKLESKWGIWWILGFGWSLLKTRRGKEEEASLNCLKTGAKCVEIEERREAKVRGPAV